MNSASLQMKVPKRDGKLSDLSDVEQPAEHHSLNTAHSTIKNPTS